MGFRGDWLPEPSPTRRSRYPAAILHLIGH